MVRKSAIREVASRVRRVHDVPFGVGVRKPQGVPHLVRSGEHHAFGIESAAPVERASRSEYEGPDAQPRRAFTLLPYRLSAPDASATHG